MSWWYIGSVRSWIYCLVPHSSALLITFRCFRRTTQLSSRYSTTSEKLKEKMSPIPRKKTKPDRPEDPDSASDIEESEEVRHSQPGSIVRLKFTVNLEVIFSSLNPSIFCAELHAVQRDWVPVRPQPQRHHWTQRVREVKVRGSFWCLEAYYLGKILNY